MLRGVYFYLTTLTGFVTLKETEFVRILSVVVLARARCIVKLHGIAFFNRNQRDIAKKMPMPTWVDECFV